MVLDSPVTAQNDRAGRADVLRHQVMPRSGENGQKNQPTLRHTMVVRWLPRTRRLETLDLCTSRVFDVQFTGIAPVVPHFANLPFASLH